MTTTKAKDWALYNAEICLLQAQNCSDKKWAQLFKTLAENWIELIKIHDKIDSNK